MRRTLMLTAALGLGWLSLSAQAVTISLLASSGDVPSGGIVSIDIVASDLGSGEFVSAYDFSIDFDPLELAFIDGSFVVGSALGSLADEDYFDFSDFSLADSGLLQPFLSSLLLDAELAALQTDAEVTLGSFSLRARGALAELSASIGLGCNSVSGPLDAEGIAVLLDVGACSGTSVQIAPVAVPEPGTLMIFAAGLIGLGLAIRLRRRSRNDR